MSPERGEGRELQSNESTELQGLIDDLRLRGYPESRNVRFIDAESRAAQLICGIEEYFEQQGFFEAVRKDNQIDPELQEAVARMQIHIRNAVALNPALLSLQAVQIAAERTGALPFEETEFRHYLKPTGDIACWDCDEPILPLPTYLVVLQDGTDWAEGMYSVLMERCSLCEPAVARVAESEVYPELTIDFSAPYFDLETNETVYP